MIPEISSASHALKQGAPRQLSRLDKCVSPYAINLSSGVYSWLVSITFIIDQILGTLILVKMYRVSKLVKSTRRRVLLTALLFLSLISLVALLFSPRSHGKVFPPVDNLPQIPLSGHQRLLVLAPHSDDETLGAAGLIQAAIRLGIQVKVVVATNGDGSLSATMDDFRRIYPRPADFIRMGNLRQKETLAAMQVLGVNPDQVIFLSYPDRGISQLWSYHWSRADPYRSPYSHATVSPYSVTYNAQSIYAGEVLLADLSSILDEYHPDLIIYPHPDDYHPDHWALSAFTQLALALQEQKDASYTPDAYAYLVHRSDFPVQKGLHPTAGLYPPTALNLPTYTWYQFSLSQEDIQQKEAAVLQYRSQLPLLHELLQSFVRTNELYARVEGVDMPALGEGKIYDPMSWKDAENRTVEPVQFDPVRDVITRAMIAPTDIAALYAAREGRDRIVVCAELRGKAAPELFYSLRILAIGQDGITHQVARNRGLRKGWVHATLSGRFVCDQVSLADLGEPWVVFLGADVMQTGVGILDKIAWQQVNIQVR